MTFELSDRSFVIAEAGTCHADPNPNRRLSHALRYVDAARRAGADAVKFQMFGPFIRDSMFCWMDGDEAREPRWSASVLKLDEWYQIKEFAEAGGMMFLASVFQTPMVAWLNELQVEATKVASRAVGSFPYGDAPKPYLISLGMAPDDRMETGKAAIYLECEASYPSMLRWSGMITGFSDHSGTPWRAIDAISRGCKLIEVHYFMRTDHAGPDLPASLNLEQLKLVCEARDAFAELNRKETP